LVTKTTKTARRIPQIVLTSSRKVVECKPLALGEDEAAVDSAVRTLESAVGDCVRDVRGGGVHKMLELRNGWRVACSPAAEAEALHLFNEIVVDNTYFQHLGIEPVPDGVVVDVGANIGMFLLATNARLRHAGLPRTRKYLAIEPLESNLMAFKTNMWMHNASAGVEVVQVGVTNEATARLGEADFTYFPSMPGNSTMHPDEKIMLQRDSMRPEYFANSEVVSCPVATLTSVLKLHPDITRVDLLKIDCEGCELEVLEGLSDECWRIVAQIVLEVHDVDNRVARIEGMLKSRGFETLADAHEAGASAFLVYACRRIASPLQHIPSGG